MSCRTFAIAALAVVAFSVSGALPRVIAEAERTCASKTEAANLIAEHIRGVLILQR